MALWKEQNASTKPAPAPAPSPTPSFAPEPVPAPAESNGSEPVTARETPRVPTAAPARAVTESVIGSDLTIEGKIEGRGHVRIAGRFKGDVVVDGDLTIDKGATLTGAMKATVITVAGDVQGNVLDATRVELLASAALVGDVRAATLTVAPGSRLRGRVECGWGEGSAPAVAPASTPAATSKPAAMPARSEVKAEEPVAALDAAS